MDQLTSYSDAHDWQRESQDQAEEAALRGAEIGQAELIEQMRTRFPALWTMGGAIAAAAVSAIEDAAWNEAWEACATRHGVQVHIKRKEMK